MYSVYIYQVGIIILHTVEPGFVFVQVQRDCATILSAFFTSDGLANRALEYAVSLDHIMDFTRLRALSSLFSMINQGVRNILSYNNSHSDFPMQVTILPNIESTNSYVYLKLLFFNLRCSFNVLVSLIVSFQLSDMSF